MENPNLRSKSWYEQGRVTYDFFNPHPVADLSYFDPLEQYRRKSYSMEPRGMIVKLFLWAKWIVWRDLMALNVHWNLLISKYFSLGVFFLDYILIMEIREYFPSKCLYYINFRKFMIEVFSSFSSSACTLRSNNMRTNNMTASSPFVKFIKKFISLGCRFFSLSFQIPLGVP